MVSQHKAAFDRLVAYAFGQNDSVSDDDLEAVIHYVNELDANVQAQADTIANQREELRRRQINIDHDLETISRLREESYANLQGWNDANKRIRDMMHLERPEETPQTDCAHIHQPPRDSRGNAYNRGWWTCQYCQHQEYRYGGYKDAHEA